MINTLNDINDTTTLLLISYIILESYEIYSQKSSTMMGVLTKLYVPYKKNIANFVMLHPTYILALYILVYSNFIFESLLLVGLKSLDMIVKVKMMETVFEKKEMSQEMSLLLLQKINPLFFSLNFLVYLPLVIFSLFPYLLID
jgi:hypothetical protein